MILGVAYNKIYISIGRYTDEHNAGRIQSVQITIVVARASRLSFLSFLFLHNANMFSVNFLSCQSSSSVAPSHSAISISGGPFVWNRLELRCTSSHKIQEPGDRSDELPLCQ